MYKPIPPLSFIFYPKITRFFIIAVILCSCINTETYNGQKVEESKEGLGITIKEDSSYYLGEYVDNKMEGLGLMNLSNGNTYVGEWKNDARNGVGQAYWVDEDDLGGDSCKGEFSNNLINGVAYYSFPDGTYNKGYYKNGRMHGLGMRVWKNNEWDGDYYIGNWRNGIMYGLGKYFDKSTNVIKEGIFNNHLFIKAKPFTVQDSLEIMNDIESELQVVYKRLDSIKPLVEKMSDTLKPLF